MKNKTHKTADQVAKELEKELTADGAECFVQADGNHIRCIVFIGDVSSDESNAISNRAGEIIGKVKGFPTTLICTHATELGEHIKSGRASIQEVDEHYKTILGGGAYSDFKSLEELGDQLDKTISPFRAQFQEFLFSIEGKIYGTLEAKQEITKQVQGFADRLKLVFECVKCGEPGRLRCGRVGNSKEGVFTFDHTLQKNGKRTRVSHSGSSLVPRLVLINPAEDLRKRENRD